MKISNLSNVKNEYGVYAILNLIDGKRYIGSSVHLLRRSYEHATKLNSLKDYANKYLQRAWFKYGADAFEFHVLEYCDKDKLLEREQFWMDFYKSYDESFGYNLRKIAASNRGMTLSDETKEKIRLSNLGQKRSKETCERIKNRVITPEWRANMSKGMKGKKVSDETKALLLNYASKPKSEETKRKISNSLKGRKHSAERRQNIKLGALRKKKIM